MRISVKEVAPGLHRWVASLRNPWGVVVASAFSNNSADDAEDQLLYVLTDALTRLPAMTEAWDKALAARKDTEHRLEHDSTCNVRYHETAECDCSKSELQQLIAELEAVET